MSESTPRTRPRSNAISQEKPPDLRKQVIGDPQTMKMMGHKDGKFPDKGANKSIAKTHNVQSATDDKGKMKLDEEGAQLYKRLKQEQLQNPDKGKRLSSAQLKAIVKALQEDQPLLSDNPEAQRIMVREKGSVMNSTGLMKEANVPEKEQHAMERTMQNNMAREARHMYKKELGPGIIGKARYKFQNKEERARGAQRYQHGMLQQMGRQPEQQRTHLQMEQMQREINQLRQQLDQQPHPSPYPPQPMSKGRPSKEKEKPRGQFNFMAEPAKPGKMFRDIHSEDAGEGRGKDKDKDKRKKKDFDQRGFDEQSGQAMGQDQQMMMLMQKIQQLQRQIAQMQQQMKEQPTSPQVGKTESPKPERGKIESPAPKETEKVEPKNTKKTQFTKMAAMESQEDFDKYEQATGKKLSAAQQAAAVANKRNKNLGAFKEKNKEKDKNNIGGM